MKPHRTDGLSLTFGLIFLGIVIVWLFNQAVEVDLNAGWIVAVGLIIFGLLGLLGALRSDKHDKPSSSVPSSSVPASAEPDDAD
jgi:hypothetical protein